MLIFAANAKGTCEASKADYTYQNVDKRSNDNGVVATQKRISQECS